MGNHNQQQRRPEPQRTAVAPESTFDPAPVVAPLDLPTPVPVGPLDRIERLIGIHHAGVKDSLQITIRATAGIHAGKFEARATLRTYQGGSDYDVEIGLGPTRTAAVCDLEEKLVRKAEVDLENKRKALEKQAAALATATA